MEALLDGQSAAAVFPTGGGKSLCYQLPALTFSGLTLVVSPLIALMKDQIDTLTARQISAARLDSTLSAEEARAVIRDARSGELKLLYVAPERFNNERFRELIQQIAVSLFVIDEAHCISEWGHNFRPDYLKLPRFVRACNAERTLALTATATPIVLKDICRQFEISSQHAVTTDFYRPNLTLLSSSHSEDTRDQHLIERLKSRPAASTIVYVTLQKTAERVAEQLAAVGFDAKAYHAGLEDGMRAEVQDWFMQSSSAIVVATIAFGMGIDKSAIRYVYHYNLAKSLENYAQEIGRAGRDGLPSICEMLYCQEDLNPLQNFIFGDMPSREGIKRLVETMVYGDETMDHSFYELSTQCDIRMLVVRTLVTYLELDGFIESGTPFYSNYRFIPQVPSREILDRFEGERREFLAGMLQRCRKAKIWFSIDVLEVAKELESTRGRIVRALDYLAEQSLLELSASGVRQTYRRLKQPDNCDTLIDQLFQRMAHREETDLNRLNQVVEFIDSDSCQSSRLGAHFGQPLEQPCGHCSVCLGEESETPKVTEINIDDTVWDRLLEIRRQNSILSEPRRFTCWACGISLPQLTKARLTRHELFGCLKRVPFQRVLEAATAEKSGKAS